MQQATNSKEWGKVDEPCIEEIYLVKFIYRTRAIITRDSYIFYPLFGSQKRFFKEDFSENSMLMYG